MTVDFTNYVRVRAPEEWLLESVEQTIDSGRFDLFCQEKREEGLQFVCFIPRAGGGVGMLFRKEAPMQHMPE